MIAALVNPGRDRMDVDRHVARIRERVLHCATQEDVCDAASDPAVSRIVIDLGCCVPQFARHFELACRTYWDLGAPVLQG